MIQAEVVMAGSVDGCFELCLHILYFARPLELSETF